jgi:hypothetical protein
VNEASENRIFELSFPHFSPEIIGRVELLGTWSGTQGLPDFS